jgi:hypothetical protein
MLAKRLAWRYACLSHPILPKSYAWRVPDIMAKKRSKPNLPQEVLERARAELRGSAAADSKAKSEAQEAAAAAKSKPIVRSGSLATRRVPTKEELDQEYRHIIRDLRAMLTLAGSLFLFVIVMAIFVVPRLF